MSDRYFASIDGSNLVTGVYVFNVDTEAEGIALTRNVIDDQTATVVETFVNADQTSPTRYNYASIGFTWDDANQAFIELQPFSSWSLDSSYQWQAPVAYPSTDTVDDKFLDIFWEESDLRWVGITEPGGAPSYYWNPDTSAWISI